LNPLCKAENHQCFYANLFRESIASQEWLGDLNRQPKKLLTCDSGMAYCLGIVMAARPQEDDRHARFPGPSAAKFNVAIIEGGKNVLRFPQTLSRSNWQIHFDPDRYGGLAALDGTNVAGTANQTSEW
jgi:hypothetical protein